MVKRIQKSFPTVRNIHRVFKEQTECKRGTKKERVFLDNNRKLKVTAISSLCFNSEARGVCTDPLNFARLTDARMGFNH